MQYISQSRLECGQCANSMQAYRTKHRLINASRRHAASRTFFVFAVALCFAQAVAAQHLHARVDIDQPCIICGFSDHHDTLVSSGFETETPVLFYEQKAELCTHVRAEACFAYNARSPPFSS